MRKRNPYQVVKSMHVTEKAITLQELVSSDSNPSVERCRSPKYVFLVDKNANKHEITEAVEQIYDVRVVSVNTINLKPKKRRVRGRLGLRPGRKKAIVTLEENDFIDNI